MSVPLTVGGVTFQYPVQFDKKWAAAATGWAVAVTNALAPFSGGNGSLLTLTSKTANPSTAGFLRLAKTDTLDWRNNANSANLPLGINSYNQLTFNGVAIGAAAALTDGHIFVGDVSNQPADVAMTGDVTITDLGVTAIGAGKIGDSQIATLAGIALTKLASTTPYFWYVANSAGVLSPIGVTASRAVITDANGLPSASSVTPTELGYVSGATSSIQTQLGTLLPLSGGTLSGVLNMGSNKIISLAQGTTAGEAVAFPIGAAQISLNAISSYGFAYHTTSVQTGTTVDTVTVTVTAASQLIIQGFVTLNMDSLSGDSVGFDVNITVNGSAMNGGKSSIRINGQATHQPIITLPISVSITPGLSGSIPVVSKYTVTVGGFISIIASSLTVLVLNR